MAQAEHHLHLDTLPSLPSHSGGQWANTELASALFVAVYATAAWMVWYGIVAMLIPSNINDSTSCSHRSDTLQSLFNVICKQTNIHNRIKI